jgi:hypothetical protein
MEGFDLLFAERLNAAYAFSAADHSANEMPATNTFLRTRLDHTIRASLGSFPTALLQHEHVRPSSSLCRVYTHAPDLLTFAVTPSILMKPWFPTIPENVMLPITAFLSSLRFPIHFSVVAIEANPANSSSNRKN